MASDLLTLDEQFFLRIALKNELLSPSDADECVRVRAALAKRGKRKLLQEILLDTGLLTPDEVDEITEAQSASQVVRLDSLYGDIALRLGFARKPDLETAFAEQRARRYRVRVGEVLVDRGAISSAQHRQVLMELLKSMKSEEKEYIQNLRLKKRLAGRPADPEMEGLSEAEQIRLATTQVGWRAPPTPAAATPAAAPPSAPSTPAAKRPAPLSPSPSPAPTPAVPLPPPPRRPAPTPAGGTPVPPPPRRPAPTPASGTPLAPPPPARPPSHPPVAPRSPSAGPAAPPAPSPAPAPLSGSRPPSAPVPAAGPAPAARGHSASPRAPSPPPLPIPPALAAAPTARVPAVESSDAIDLDMFDSRSDAISEDDLPSAPPAPRRARLVDSASSEDFLGDSSDDDNRIAIAPLPAKAAADEIAARRRPSAPPAPAPAPAAASAPAAGEVSARRESIQQWLGLESVAGGGGAAAAPPAAASGARPAASPAVGAAGAPGDSDVSDRRTRPSSDDELPESFFASNVLAVQAEARPARARGLVETPEPEPLLPLPSPLPSPAVRPGGAPAARGAGPAGGPPSERTGGSRRLPKAGAKGASGRVPAAAKSGRRRRPDPAKLLESAIETFDETSASASTTTNVRLAASDLEQVESDLSEVESMIQAGAPSFSSLKGRRSSGERPPAFSADEYVKRKRRRGALARAVAGAVVVFVLLPFGAGVYFARGNSARMAEARDALARGDPEAAEAAAAEAGPFWVGERRLDALRREIAFRRALAPVERARDERRYEDALAALRSVRDAHRDMAAEVSAVEADLLLASHLDAGGKAESEGDLARAVSLYEHARRAAPARAEEPDRRIAAIRARLEREVADAEAGGDLERQVEAYRRMNAVFGGKEQALEAKVLAFDLQRLLAEGDAACERRDYERALGAYYKASEAARKLGRQDAASEVEEKTRAARRLGQFQSYFNKGQAAEAKGKLDDALQAYRSALTWIDKGDSGRAQLVQQRIEATEKRRAREGVDAEAARLWQEAVQALQQSRTDAAAAALEALRQVKPDDERVERAIAFAREVTDMVYVPAGEFRMGSALGTAGADRDEMPERRLALPAYFVDRFETRNRSYMAFIEATGERRPEQWTLDRGAGKPKGFPPEQADHPVVNVSWEEASRFAAWAKKRLPSEEEWEKAARGPDGRAYPWGDAADGARPNIDAKISSRISIQTRPGGTSAGDASPYGCADMGGNVSEWTASPYAPYPGAEAGGGDYDGEKRVIRGGSWRYGAAYARCANRDRSKPGERYAETGFRCVKDIPEWFAELR